MLAWPAISARRSTSGAQKLTIVVPYDAGGSTDMSTRIIAQKLLEFGFDVVVVNQTGAAGTTGTHWCSQQPPHRGVLCVATVSSFLFMPSIEDTGYSWNDFEPVATWGGGSFAFAVKTDSKYRSIDQVVHDAKANSGRLTIGSTGTGDYQFLVEQMFDQARAEVTYVPFRGGAEVMTNLLGGHIDVGYLSVATLNPLVQSGQLRMIAHTSPFAQRLEEFPEVPHISEYGYRQHAVSFYSLWSPKGTPPALRAAVADAVARACRDPRVIEENRKIGVTMQCLGSEATYEETSKLVRTLVPVFTAWAKGR